MAQRKDTIDCPGCGRRLIAPGEDWKGTSKCPACGAVFTPTTSRTAPMAGLDPAGGARTAGQEPSTSVQARRKRRRRSQPAASKRVPVVTPAGKASFAVGVIAHIAVVTFGHVEQGRPIGANILLAPVVGVYAAVVVM